MFVGEILRRYRRGFTCRYIADNLGVAPGYVRSVVSDAHTANEESSCSLRSQPAPLREAKPVYGETAPPPHKGNTRARRRAAELTRNAIKRAEALQALKEADAELADLE